MHETNPTVALLYDPAKNIQVIIENKICIGKPNAHNTGAEVNTKPFWEKQGA
jgi:hypothetical protein